MLPDQSLRSEVHLAMIANMVIKIGSGHRPQHLYMTEWRESLNFSVQQIADRVEVNRETIWRWEHEQHRLNPEKIAQYAYALGIAPSAVWDKSSRVAAPVV